MTRPTEGTMPAAERACRSTSSDGRELREPPRRNRSGRLLDTLSAGSEVARHRHRPDAASRMNCAMAEAAVRFAKGVVSPAAKAEFGKGLKGISQASAYVCRPRNGTRKALRARLRQCARHRLLHPCRRQDVARSSRAPERSRPASWTACATAPADRSRRCSDPAATQTTRLHFHFDLAPRRNGGTFCQ